MDDRVGDRRAERDSQPRRGYELRHPRAASKWRAGSSLALVPPGGQAPVLCCSTILNRDEIMAMGTDENTRRDLLLLLPIDTGDRVTDVHIQLLGENGLQVTAADANALDDAAQHLETRVYQNESGPPDANGRHIVTGWVARVPVTLNPTRPWDIGGDRYPLTVKASYHVAGDVQPRAFSSRGAIDAQVASGIYEMGIASGILPLICVGAAVRRWRRTR